MSFMKKLFGKDNKSPQSNNKPDINTLLDSPDTGNIIIELDDYVCKLCSYGEALDRLTEPQKNFYFNQNLEREINNGGFNQFFFNSSGDFAHETLISLKAIGANKTANILQQAIDQFPSSKAPQSEAERRKQIEEIEGKQMKFGSNLIKNFMLTTITYTILILSI